MLHWDCQEFQRTDQEEHSSAQHKTLALSGGPVYFCSVFCKNSNLFVMLGIIKYLPISFLQRTGSLAIYINIWSLRTHSEPKYSYSFPSGSVSSELYFDAAECTDLKRGYSSLFFHIVTVWWAYLLYIVCTVCCTVVLYQYFYSSDIISQQIWLLWSSSTTNAPHNLP